MSLLPHTGSVSTRSSRRSIWLGGLRDLVVPPVCMSCQTRLATSDTLCASCWETIRFIQHPLCNRLGIPMPYDPGGEIVSARALANPPDYARARAFAEHTGVVQELIVAFKYYDQLAPRALLGRWLMTAGRDLIADCDIIMPVPMHRLRLLSRRFNQSAILAREVASHSGKPVLLQTLQRHKRTRRQVELTKSEREKNPRGAFRIPTRKLSLVAGKRVLLVDDVISTGATANACARELLKAGAHDVDVLAVSLATGRPDLIAF